MSTKPFALVLALLATIGCGASAEVTETPSPELPKADATPPLPEEDTSSIDTAAPPDSAPAIVDRDEDQLDDARELEWARAYLPYLSISPSDKCSTHGVLARVSPHPSEKGRVMIWYDVLYDADCGTNGHAGDDEMFGVVIDPKKPAPDGILAIRTISHQNTPCEHSVTCGRCAGMKACGTAKRDGKDTPVVYPSKDKHGNYADAAVCASSFVCDFGGCQLSPTPDVPAIVNVGEPAHPFVHDLTTEGFVTAAAGWKHSELMHFDPWKPGNFGGAGDVSKDLVDASFVIDTKACP